MLPLQKADINIGDSGNVITGIGSKPQFVVWPTLTLAKTMVG